jgi:SRSO17 transposase
MDAKEMERYRPRLSRFLSSFEGAFGRPEPRAHLGDYVRGQLSDLPRKSIEPIALEANVPPRTLQYFLSSACWDEELIRRRLQERVVARQSKLDVGIIDETSYAKKGDKTPGVKRQHCGASGKKDNCVVSVHLGFLGAGGFRALLDGELFLPEDWSADRRRCEEAGIPAEMFYRPKWQIALELLDRAEKNGVHLPWLTYDEGYGRIPKFHEGLNERGQLYVGEVPCNFSGWCKGVHAGVAASRVDDLVARSPVFTEQQWRPYHIKDGGKGPVVWEAKFVYGFYYSDGGEARGPRWLIVARNALDHEEIKYFVSNGPPATPRRELLRAGFSRFAVERCFEDDKTEIGLDHFEVRNYSSVKRHLMISAISLMFLAEIHQEDREKKSRVDSLPGSHGRECDDHGPGDGPGSERAVFGKDRIDYQPPAGTKRDGTKKPPQGKVASFAPRWVPDRPHDQMPA